MHDRRRRWLPAEVGRTWGAPVVRIEVVRPIDHLAHHARCVSDLGSTETVLAPAVYAKTGPCRRIRSSHGATVVQSRRAVGPRLKDVDGTVMLNGEGWLTVHDLCLKAGCPTVAVVLLRARSG
jgi:hypothetical protein